MKFADSPTYKARSLKISVDLPPVLELSPALKTPRTVSTRSVPLSCLLTPPPDLGTALEASRI
jgi:hypothetical protein